MFDTMITPFLMTILYYLGCAGIIIGTGTFIVTGYDGYHWLLSLGGGAIGLLMWRITCEFIVVRFRIYEVLTEIRDQGVNNRLAAIEEDVDNPGRKEPKIRQWVRENEKD